MTIKYTITADTFGAVEQLEIGKHTFEREHKHQEFGLLSGGIDFSEQAVNAGIRGDIADEIFDAIDASTLVLDLVNISDDLEND